MSESPGSMHAAPPRKRSPLLQAGWAHPHQAGRLTAAGLFLAAQAAVVGTVGYREDETFAFRMFSEASTIEPHIYAVYVNASGERVEEELHEAPWATAALGRPEYAHFGLPRVASYGAEVQRFRWREATRYLAAHWPAREGETRPAERLKLRIVTSTNGHSPKETWDEYGVPQ